MNFDYISKYVAITLFALLSLCNNLVGSHLLTSTEFKVGVVAKYQIFRFGVDFILSRSSCGAYSHYPPTGVKSLRGYLCTSSYYTY
jgi:hypothetical protein